MDSCPSDFAHSREDKLNHFGKPGNINEIQDAVSNTSYKTKQTSKALAEVKILNNTIQYLLELSLSLVGALPKASRTGLICRILSSMFLYGARPR